LNLFSQWYLFFVFHSRYEVDYSAADDFPASKMASSCLCTSGEAGQANLGEGETRDLQDSSNSKPGSKQRKLLSEGGREAAFAYGKQLLEDKTAFKPQELEEEKDTVYIGDRSVFVLYLEDGDVHSILVNN
jgi:hypothetical protein